VGQLAASERRRGGPGDGEDHGSAHPAGCPRPVRADCTSPRRTLHAAVRTLHLALCALCSAPFTPHSSRFPSGLRRTP
jgi:hypothetical protein